MSHKPMRFVHASDLHLEQPLSGLTSIPEHLRELLRDAPYHAAEQVFETALTENADALLLAGDVVDIPLAGPRSVVFLLEQFRRLEARGIPVFWAGGRVDRPELWPPSTPLPENVHMFPVGKVGQHDLVRDGKVIAKVQGMSCDEDGVVNASGFHRDAHGLFTVGVAHGTSDAPGKEGDRVHYMALGGRHRRATVDHEPGVAHFPGTPQGRSPEEAGPAGCAVVQVDETRKAKTKFVSTDVVRWANETIEFTDGTSSEQLRGRMRERLEKLRKSTQDIDHLVSWKLRGAGPLLAKLRADGLCQELLDDLQKFDGRQQPACWSYEVICQDRFVAPHEWMDQETILGDLLRQFNLLRNSEAFVLDMRDMLPKPLPDATLAKLATIRPQDKQELLDRAEKLGVALLTE
ncbi:putative metallophosphoesterase YhaO [Posidoniimonas polymericola]|uniref:Putative metallophosphoesterase YhaO n=1 Tax=Posidoniimonas polymericola TaxID=2528002 RepID=A0A5C5YQ91_9BACT|nr:DNA repair exonuclease [Posidoniimonas polymericola]TWT76930.1 putative metallophosphoesterase YhaO [Posidoniimonas polymericola]